MSLGYEIRNLIERTHDEVDELHFADGAQAAIAHTTGRANDGAFADGRINHALPAKPLQQPFAGFERAAVHTDIFPHQNDRRVALHFLKHRLLDGFEKSDLRSVGRDAVRSGAVWFGHGYLRAFLEALAAAVFAFFFGAAFVAIFVAGFPPFVDFASFPTLCCEACVSPK